MIPKLIHQIWLSEDEEIPEAWQESPRLWQQHHPHWEYRLWNRAEVLELLDSHFPDYRELWDSLPYLVAKVDMARYLILLVYGGVYSDHDVLCQRPLDELLHYDAVLPATQPFGVSNDFMMASPNSALFREIVGHLPSNSRLWNQVFVPPYLRVMCGVGSFYVSTCYWRTRGREKVFILPPELYAGHDQTSLVRHIRGNSWGAWDSVLFRKLWRHRKKLLGAAAVLAAWFLFR